MRPDEISKQKKQYTYLYFQNNSLFLSPQNGNAVCNNIIEALCLQCCKENLGNFLNEYNERMTERIFYAI